MLLILIASLALGLAFLAVCKLGAHEAADVLSQRYVEPSSPDNPQRREIARIPLFELWPGHTFELNLY